MTPMTVPMTVPRSLQLWSGGRRARVLHWCLALAAGTVIMALGRANWIGSWKAGLDAGTGSLGLIGPVCAGLAALVYGSMRANGWDGFVAGMRRGHLAWLAPLARVWTLGVVTMVACTVVALATAQLLGAKAAPHMLWAVPLVLVTLAAEVTLGAVLGVSAPRFLSTPLAALAPFLLETFSRGGPIPGIFRTGGVTGPLAGESYEWRVLLLNAGVCAALTLTLGLGLVVQVVPVPPRLAWIGVVLGLAAATVPWSLLESGGHERYRPLADPPLVCRGKAPSVCLSEDTTRPMANLVSELHRQGEALQALGVRLPERFVQDLPGRPVGDDGVLLLVGDDTTASSVDPVTVSYSLATPRGCSAYQQTPPEAAWMSRQLLADWIAGQAGLAGSGFWTGYPAAEHWLGSPSTQQKRWVVTTYAALRDCRLNDLELPFPVSPA